MKAAGWMSEFPDSLEPLELPDVPRVARSGPVLSGARGDGAREPNCGGSAGRR